MTQKIGRDKLPDPMEGYLVHLVKRNDGTSVFRVFGDGKYNGTLEGDVKNSELYFYGYKPKSHYDFALNVGNQMINFSKFNPIAIRSKNEFKGGYLEIEFPKDSYDELVHSLIDLAKFSY